MVVSSDVPDSGLFHYCITPGCGYTVHWEGGSAADDPSLDHLEDHPDHTVRGGVNDRHRDRYRRQRAGEIDITEKTLRDGFDEPGSDGRHHPVYKRDLLRRALESEEPVTEIEYKRDGEEVAVHAIQEADGTAWFCSIDHSEWSDSPPRVSFRKCYWDAGVDSFRDWSSLATGALSGPQRLPSWEALFTVFNAALTDYNDEVRTNE